MSVKVGIWFRRVVLFLVSVAMILVSLQFIAIQVGLSPTHSVGLFGFSFSVAQESNVLGAVGSSMVLLVMGFVLMSLAFMGISGPKRAFILNGGGDDIKRGKGTVSVSEQSLVKLLAYTAEDIDGINGASPTLTLGKSGWKVKCTVALWHDVLLTQVVEDLRHALRHTLERHTGLQVDRIDVTVQHYPIHGNARVS